MEAIRRKRLIGTAWYAARRGPGIELTDQTAVNRSRDKVATRPGGGKYHGSVDTLQTFEDGTKQ